MNARRWKRYPNYRDSGVEWLGEVPSHWQSKRLRFAVEFNPPRSQANHLPGSTEVSFVPMEAVGEWGGIDLSTSKSIDAIGSGYTWFQDGDVVVAKITPCFENGKGALAQGLTNGAAFGTTELHVLRPQHVLDGRFLFYLTLTHPFREVGASTMYGAGGQKRVPENFIRDYRPGMPPLSEQRAIAAFLDRETARIDALIAKKEELIRLLEEKRIALISHVVTKGLDPSVPMRDSGVVWLGEIPAHWGRTRLKHATSRIVDCPHSTPTYSANGDHLVVRTADVVAGRLIVDSMYRVDDEQYAARIAREPVLAGDIVYGREGERYGLAAQVPAGVSICLGQRMMQFRADAEHDGTYVMWALNATSTYSQAQLDTFGSTSPHVNVSTIRNFLLPEPPLQEQRDIGTLLEGATRRVDELCDKLRESEQLLREQRQALITAAVTGQIDVRDELEPTSTPAVEAARPRADAFA